MAAEDLDDGGVARQSQVLIENIISTLLDRGRWPPDVPLLVCYKWELGCGVRGSC
jgi:hypothetical protein